MGKITRASNPLEGHEAPIFAVALAVADSHSIDMRGYATLRFRRHSGSVTQLTWYESDTTDGPWVPCRVNNVALTNNVGDYWDNLQMEAGAAFFLRATGNVAGEIKAGRKG